MTRHRRPSDQIAGDLMDLARVIELDRSLAPGTVVVSLYADVIRRLARELRAAKEDGSEQRGAVDAR